MKRRGPVVRFENTGSNTKVDNGCRIVAPMGVLEKSPITKSRAEIFSTMDHQACGRLFWHLLLHSGAQSTTLRGMHDVYDQFAHESGSTLLGLGMAIFDRIRGRQKFSFRTV